MSRMTSSAFEVGRVAERCAASGEPLKPGDAFVAALVETDGPGGWARVDYSPAAWEGGARPRRMAAHWRGVVPAPGGGAKLVIDGASLLGLFEQLEGAEAASRIAFRFVLALMLVRKRLLRLAGRREAGASGRACLLIHSRGASPEDPPVEVIDPALDEATITEVTEQLRVALGLEK